ncbi:MAG: transposase [Thermoanaerobaculales bacterium]|nr:transposase [Thermoanaerobaculales bacterium]
MLERLATEAGAAAYAKRKIPVEPVFGNLKANLRFRRFSRRSLDAASSEWRLICTVHNLLTTAEFGSFGSCAVRLFGAKVIMPCEGFS